MNNTNEMQLSDLSWSIRGTLGRKLLKKSQQYEGVVDFTLGDPDIPTPDGICDAAINAIREHKKRYIAAGGIAPLRLERLPDKTGRVASAEKGIINHIRIYANMRKQIFLALALLVALVVNAEPIVRIVGTNAPDEAFATDQVRLVLTSTNVDVVNNEGSVLLSVPRACIIP